MNDTFSDGVHGSDPDMHVLSIVLFILSFLVVYAIESYTAMDTETLIKITPVHRSRGTKTVSTAYPKC